MLAGRGTLQREATAGLAMVMQVIVSEGHMDLAMVVRHMIGAMTTGVMVGVMHTAVGLQHQLVKVLTLGLALRGSMLDLQREHLVHMRGRQPACNRDSL